MKAGRDRRPEAARSGAGHASPSSQRRKSSTRDRLTTGSKAGRGRATIRSRLPCYFTTLAIAGIEMMQLREIRKKRFASSSSERMSSERSIT